MSVGAFTDKNQQPTDEEVMAAVGSMLPRWEALVAFIRAGYPVQEDFKFLYGKKYGWALRFRVRGKLLASLYPTRGGFTVQVNLGPSAVDEVLRTEPGENVQRAISAAHPYPEGRWLFIPIRSEDDAADIEWIIGLRAASAGLQKPPVPGNREG